MDYIQPANTFMERVCATVSIGGVNVAEALVAKGLATVVRYSADNDQVSSCIIIDLMERSISHVRSFALIEEFTL